MLVIDRVVGTYLIGFVALGYLLYGKMDVFGIKLEFKLVGFVGLACAPAVSCMKWFCQRKETEIYGLNQRADLGVSVWLSICWSGSVCVCVCVCVCGGGVSHT
jgi:membrane protein implicated in regulation of membrane protease activity